VYVCICHGVTDHQIREVAQGGCRSVAELTMRTGAGANCGSCLEVAAELLDQIHGKARPLPLPVLSHAA
jgi:bacterioferritin-associated ferredoxin